MNLRIHFARFLIRVGRFVQELAVTVLRPAGLIEFGRRNYARPGEVSAWADRQLVDKGLNPEETVLETAFPIREGRIFILGAGGGREAVYFARKGLDVTAVDFVPEMAAAARRNLEEFGLRGEVFVREVSALTLPEAGFDFVWISMSLYSAVPTRRRRVRMLRNLCAGLKPRGVLFCNFHWDPRKGGSRIAEGLKRAFAFLTLGNFQYQKGDMLWGHSEFIHAFTNEEELRGEFRAGGFRVLSIHLNRETRRAGAILQKSPESP